MARYLDTVVDEVRRLIQDDENNLSEELSNLVQHAVDVLSIDAPRLIIEDETGDGATYEWTVPSSWVEEFSQVIRVEYPAGETGERAPELLDESDYEVVRTATGTFKWRLLNYTPSTGEKVRFTFTAPHSLTTTSSTIPNRLKESSVIFLAAGLACGALAAHVSQYRDSSIAADTVDYGSRSERYWQAAEKYIDMSGLRISLESSRARTTIPYAEKDLDLTAYSWGRSMLFHTRRRR